MLLKSSLSLLALAGLPGVTAWGTVGHEVVATIAQIHLHPSVLPTMCDILDYTSRNPDEPQCHLAPIATWADKLRYKMRWSAAMHYIGALDDYPSRTCLFPGPRGWAGSKRINVLGAIRNDSNILESWVEDTKLGLESDGVHYVANEALKFLVHFLGDMHMPLHLTGRDRGGNSDKVLFDGRQSNLHSVWDNLLIAKSLRSMGYNYTRPLPIPQVEYNLRGTIYDPYVRRIIWEGILGKWKDEIPSWLTCPKSQTAKRSPLNPSTSTVSFLITSIWQQALSMWKSLNGFNRVAADDTDDDIICPYHWAEPVHALNCEIVWPEALDEPPYKQHSFTLRDSPERDGDAADFKGPYLELDTPEYAGVIAREWIIEKLLAQAGIRLAGVLNYLFADLSNGDLKRSDELFVTF